MIIKDFKRLDEGTLSQIRSLEQAVMKQDGERNEVYLDTSLHFNNSIKHTFIAYEKDQPISVLHLFLPTSREAELCAMTLPDYRGRGYFSALLLCAGKELSKYGIPDILFVADRRDSNKSLMDHLDANYDFSEYAMALEKNSWHDQSQDNGIRLIKTKFGDLDTLTDISRAVFGESEADARSRIEKSLLARTREGFAANLSGKLVGMCYVDYEERDPGVFSFGVLPEFQGKGYGRRFLSLIIGHLFNRGAVRVKLEVDSKNDRALNLYRSIGFAVSSGYDYYRMAVKHIYNV